MNPEHKPSIPEATSDSENLSLNSADDLLHPEIREFAASDGYRFQYRYWKTNREQPLGIIVALHGIQSHSGWYEYSCQIMCEAGFEVCFLDRRGSGLNEESRGHVAHVERLMNDVLQFLREQNHRRNHEAPNQPIILLGISWGGKLATALTARSQNLIDALALLSPGIQTRVRPSFFQKLLLKLAVSLGKSRELTRIPLDDPTLFTGNPAGQKFIGNDPLALHKITTSFLNASCELDRLMEDAPQHIRCPILLMLSGKDRIIDNAATKTYFQQITPSQQKLIEYPDAEHTLEFEPCREQFISDLIDWLKSVSRPQQG